MAKKISKQQLDKILKTPISNLSSTEFDIFIDAYRQRNKKNPTIDSEIDERIKNQKLEELNAKSTFDATVDDIMRERRYGIPSQPITKKTVTKITHPSMTKSISTPNDFNKIRSYNRNAPFELNDNSHQMPPHTYDLTNKAGIKSFRKGASEYFSNRNSYMQNNSSEFKEQQTSKRAIKPSEQHTYPRPKPFERPTPIRNFDHLLPHGGIRARESLITNKPEIRPYGKAPMDSVNNTAQEDATNNAKRGANKRKNTDGESVGVMNITAKTVKITSDKITNSSKKDEPKVDNPLLGGKSPKPNELLRLTSKMVIGRILLPNIDPDVRLLMTLIMKPVMKALGRAVRGVGTKIKDAWKFRSVDKDDGGIIGRVKTGVKNMKLGERMDTLKTVPSNIKNSAIDTWNKIKGAPATIRKSTSDMWNDVSQRMKTTDSVTSGEDPQMGKIRRSYGIFFNYLNNKSNIFKGSINKMFDGMFSNTMKFGGMIGKFFKGFSLGKGKDGKGGWLSSILSTLGGLLPKLVGLVSGLITKVVGVIGAIAGMVKWLRGLGGGGGTLDGDIPDRRNKKSKSKPKPKGRAKRTKITPRSTRTSPPKRGMFGKLWDGAKSLGTKAMKAGGLKALGKSALKKIPVISLLAGLGFGAQRLLEGDFKGAGMEVMSGVASTVPIVGTGISVGTDVALMAHDMQRNNMTAPTNDVISEIYRDTKEYNINKDVRGQEVKVQPVIIDNSSSSVINGGGGGGGFVGSPEPLIIDPRNNILTHIVLNSLSKGTI